MEPIVRSFSIGLGLTVADPHAGPVFVDPSAIYLVSLARKIDPKRGGGGIGGQLAMAAIQHQLEQNPQTRILGADVAQLPQAAREHASMKKVGSQTLVAVVPRARVQRISFSVFTGMRVDLANGTVIGLPMMPWSFKKARTAFAANGWRLRD
jgi:hypothetical protein